MYATRLVIQDAKITFHFQSNGMVPFLLFPFTLLSLCLWFSHCVCLSLSHCVCLCVFFRVYVCILSLNI